MPTVSLYSPMISIETANSKKLFLFCNVVNVSATPRSGTLHILAGDGSSVSTASYNNVQPGVGTGISINQTALPANPAIITLVYAKVTVQGSAKDIRAGLVLADNKGNTICSAEAH